MNSVYDEVALLEMEEACYAQLLCSSRSPTLHRPWQAYNAWVDQFIQEAGARGHAVRRQRGTFDGFSAFCFFEKRDMDTNALIAYARHLFLTQHG